MKYTVLLLTSFLIAAWFLFWSGPQEAPVAQLQIAERPQGNEQFSSLLIQNPAESIESSNDGEKESMERVEKEANLASEASAHQAKLDNPVPTIAQRRSSLATTIAHRDVADFAKALDKRIAGDYQHSEWSSNALKAVEQKLTPSGRKKFEFFSAECLEDFCYADVQTGQRELNRLLDERVNDFANDPPTDMFDLALVMTIDSGLRRVYVFGTSFGMDRGPD